MRVSVSVTPGNVLDAVVEEFHQMLVVVGIHLDKHRIGTRGEVAFHNLRNFLKFFCGLAVRETLSRV